MSPSSGGSQGRRRVKTDALDLEAITELVLAGRGIPVTAREGDRSWRVGGAPEPPGPDPDRDEEPAAGPAGPAFPGLTLALPDVLGTKVGRLVAAEFATRSGWQRWARPGSSGSPRTGDCRSAGRSRSGW